MSLSRPSVWHLAPSTVHLEEGTFLLFLPHVRQWFGTLPVVLFLTLPLRGTPLLFLVYRILMLLLLLLLLLLLSILL